MTMTMTTNETPTTPTKKRSGPRTISERYALVREAGKARLAKLEAKIEAKTDELAHLFEQAEALRAEIGFHEDDSAGFELTAAGVDALAQTDPSELLADD